MDDISGDQVNPVNEHLTGGNEALTKGENETREFIRDFPFFFQVGKLPERSLVLKIFLGKSV